MALKPLLLPKPMSGIQDMSHIAAPKEAAA